MRGIVRIALRNVRRQAKRAVLLGGAIAFGVMIISLLNAFTSGAVGNIKNNFSYAAGGHIYVVGTELTDTMREVDRISDDAALEAAITGDDPRVLSIHRRSTSFATLIFGSKAVTHAIEGIHFEAEPDLSKGLHVSSGSIDDLADPRSLILPSPAAEKLGVIVGETVLVRLQTVTGQQNVGELLVTAIIDDPMGLGLSSAYAHRTYVNSLIGLEPGAYQMFNVFLHDLRDVDRVAAELHDALAQTGAPVERPISAAMSQAELEEEGLDALGQLFGGATARVIEEPWDGTKFSIMTINEMMEPVVAAMGVLDGVAFGIFVIILVITGVGILNTFRMVIIERTREIGTMRAFGMQKGPLRRIFLWEAAIMSLGGGAAGLILAGGIAGIVSRLTLPNVAGLGFFLDQGHLTFAMTPGALAGNVLVLLIISLLAALMPANAAAKLKPVEALGKHY